MAVLFAAVELAYPRRADVGLSAFWGFWAVQLWRAGTNARPLYSHCLQGRQRRRRRRAPGAAKPLQPAVRPEKVCEASVLHAASSV